MTSIRNVVVPISRDWTSIGREGGGIERFLALLFKYAPSFGLRLTVLCSGYRDETVDSVHFRPIMPHAASELEFTRALRRQLVRGILDLPTDAVVLANTAQYAWAFRQTGLPIVLLSHAAPAEQLRLSHSSLFVHLFQIFVEHRALKEAQRVVVVNEGIVKYYLSRYPGIQSSKFVVVPLGVDLSVLDARPRRNPLERLALSSSTSIVLFVARLSPEKNLGLFIAACDALKVRGEAFDAVVVGKGVDAPTLVDAMAARSWLHWIPEFADYSDLLDLMSVSRLLAVTSRYESGPLVLLEAIGVGTPVVSTDVGRARELLSGSLGRIAPGDPASFSAALQDVLSWPRDEIQAASARVRELIDFRATMRAMLDVLSEARQSPLPSSRAA